MARATSGRRHRVRGWRRIQASAFIAEQGVYLLDCGEARLPRIASACAVHRSSSSSSGGSTSDEGGLSVPSSSQGMRREEEPFPSNNLSQSSLFFD